MPSTLLGITVAAVAALCWGSVYATTQRLVGPGNFTPMQLLTACFYVGSLLMLPFIWFHREAISTTEQSAGSFIALLITLLVAEGLVFYSIQLLGGAEASLVQASYPLWTALSLFFASGETPSVLTMIGAALIFAGIGFIVKYGENPEQSNANQENAENPSFVLPATKYDSIT